MLIRRPGMKQGDTRAPLPYPSRIPRQAFPAASSPPRLRSLRTHELAADYAATVARHLGRPLAYTYFSSAPGPPDPRLEDWIRSSGWCLRSAAGRCRSHPSRPRCTRRWRPCRSAPVRRYPIRAGHDDVTHEALPHGDPMAMVTNRSPVEMAR